MQSRPPLKHKAVLGIFENRRAAEDAVSALRRVGFPLNDIVMDEDLDELSLSALEAQTLVDSSRRGGVLLSLRTNDTEDMANARRVLQTTGARAIATAYEERQPP